jgi:hypothetical protein
MENGRVVELVNTIEAAMRELAAHTDNGYITACVVDGSFVLNSGADENGQTKLSFYRGQNNE